MAESPLKRQREETHDLENSLEDAKRQKTYTQILSLLETEEEEPTQDLSFLMSTLETELYFDENCNFDLTISDLTDPEIVSATDSSDFTSPVSTIDSSGDKESVIRHLLEASDDELGIPQAEVGHLLEASEDEINGGDEFDDDRFFSGCDGLWELEDEAANYYTYLQSELFM